MVPLTQLRVGEVNSIKKIDGQDKTRQFLNSLGFVEGSEVSIISELAGNLIVNIKDSRIAISKEMASKIVV
ncbi:hypothetical protein SDC9_142008 [bioreactor metagenome]|uniref:Ferrous iron transporter FeoA-like domain-containing protein n=1 Tax=bioreactor metagenome TaxID=1076179 RepID=A0A645E013_9ZZZZ